ncbi:MAG: LacI family DNA-binding transcriptional regulator [Paludibacteraceae bacterium]|nr:LacI family DNA-binding transcriptional regulator [Paludibacteraceae bacterium]
MKPITIKDIAHELHVSVSTVSRALQNHPDISNRTKSLVKACAQKLNYQPNLLASNLRTCRNTTIGVVIPELNHHFFSSVLNGIEQAANEAGYQVLICQTSERVNKEVQAVKTLLTSRVAGILVGLSKETVDLQHIKEIMERGVPVVLYDRPCPSLPCDQVVSDDYQGAYDAVEYLIQTGRKRIMCFASSMQLEMSRRRYQGWRDAMQHYGISISDDMVVECDTRLQAINDTPGILHLDTRPDAVFCVNDDAAVGVLQVAQSLGVKVPQELAICGFSDAPISRVTMPMLTTVQQHGDEIGKRATERLLKRLDGNKYIPQTEMILAELLVRETT